METDQKLLNGLEKPQLTRYLSITSYLQDYYLHRKSQQFDFSYEAWARELNFRSRSSLRMMAYGKRSISETFVDRHCAAENFSSKEKQYILLISKIQNTKNIDLKKIYLDQVYELTDFEFKKNEINNAFDFLSSPEMYLIQMLVSFEDFTATIKSIKKILSLEISKVQACIKKLEKMGLIEGFLSETQAETIWRSKAKFFSVQGPAERTAIDEFHRQTLKETEKIIRQDILDKKIKSLFFSLNESSYSDFIETLDQFTNKLKVKYANDFIQNKKIYKLNLQVYPVTEKCETIQSKQSTLNERKHDQKKR